MNSPVLQRLRGEDFSVAVGFHSNPAAVRRRLARMPEVAAIREALKQGAITEETIRRFVSHLTSDFVRGEHFAHEDALAAICVALEAQPTDFADEFLHDLARLKLAELSLAIRVARECVDRRVGVANRTDRTLNLPLGVEEMPLSLSSWESTFGKNGFRETNAVGVCEV